MNECGECKACCTVLGVAKLRKDDYLPCTHLCEQGCNIYVQRPPECQFYQCHWLRTKASPEVRPDRCGLILEATETTIGKAIVCREVWDGAWEGPTAQAWAYRIAQQHKAYLYLVTRSGRRAFFPQWVAHLADQAEALVMAYKSWREVEAEQQAATAVEAVAQVTQEGEERAVDQYVRKLRRRRNARSVPKLSEKTKAALRKQLRQREKRKINARL